MMFHILTVQSPGDKTRWLRYTCFVCQETKVTQVSQKFVDYLIGIMHRNKMADKDPRFKTNILFQCDTCEKAPNLVADVGLTVKLKIKPPPDGLSKFIKEVSIKAERIVGEKEKILDEIQMKKMQLEKLVVDVRETSAQLSVIKRKMEHIKI